MLIDQLEKLGRLLMWVVISGVLVVAFAVVPLRMVEQDDEANALRAAVRAAEKQLQDALDAKEEARPKRIPLKGMGTYLSALDESSARGHFWFSNVSPRKGSVCVKGVATNLSGESTDSLPTCTMVGPYSTANIEMMFAGGWISKNCEGGCSMEIKSADEFVAEEPSKPAAPKK